MSWRFRKSFTVIPGLKLNLSKSGLSASIGGAPFTLNVSPRGAMGTASIPGTGVSYRHHFDANPAAPSSPTSIAPSASPNLVPVQPYTNIAPIEKIQSASTELLTSESLKELKHLIQTAFQQRDEISRDLGEARYAKADAKVRYESWETGFLFKHLFKKSLLKRKANVELETAKVEELEEQLRQSTIATHIEVEPDQADLYYRMRDAFAGLSECKAIWDIKTHQATDKFHERTTAIVKVQRQLVKFSLGSCDLLQWEQKIPHLENSKGGDLYLYPGFILYRAAKEAFSVIEYHDVKGNAERTGFYEVEGVPDDSQVIGQTWAKANKDGSRDRRFNDNYQIPIAEYGTVTLKSDNGLWEEFECSNPQRLENFLHTWNAFAASFAAIE